MATWTAAQIGASNGAYAGRTVEFTTDDDEHVRGVLWQSDGPPGAIYTYLNVDGRLHSLTKLTKVEVL